MSTYAQVGTLSQGEEFVVLEEELNDEGAMMVRFSKGWVPMATGDKAEILVPTSMLNTVADASYEIVLDEVEWEEVESDNTVIWLRTGNWKMEERMKQEEEQLQEQETAAGAHEGEGGAAAESNLSPAVSTKPAQVAVGAHSGGQHASERARHPSLGRISQTPEEAEAEAAMLEMFAKLAGVCGTHYCHNAALVREDFEMDSAKCVQHYYDLGSFLAPPQTRTRHSAC